MKRLYILYYQPNVIPPQVVGDLFSISWGQLGTYVAAVNHILKRPEDNPTIGLLVCKTKENVLAQYVLESSSQPIGISEYELTKLQPADFKGTLPSIEEIENQLKDEFNR